MKIWYLNVDNDFITNGILTLLILSRHRLTYPRSDCQITPRYLYENKNTNRLFDSVLLWLITIFPIDRFNYLSV